MYRAISGKESRMKWLEVGASVEMQKESKVTNGNKSDKWKRERNWDNQLSRVR